MVQKNKKTVIASSIVTLLPLAAGLLLWGWLPDPIATHFGADNAPNGWSSKVFTVFGLPLFLLAVHLLCVFVVAEDPKKQNISPAIFRLVCWICPACSVFCGVSIYGNALGWGFDIGREILLFLGVLFVALGVCLLRVRQNYTVGIRLPWTLSDEENWNRTHCMAGWTWILGGGILLANVWLRQTWLTVGVIAACAVIPAVYSFVLYKHLS